MKSVVIFGSLVALACASADPQITARAVVPRQDDPAFLGFVSASGFSDARSCDFPATLARSGSLAQCCAPSSSCTFWTSCSAGTLFAGQTSLFCDQGYCNTAVLVNTIGASNGQNYLGCWATSLGEAPFTIVKNIGSASRGGSAVTTSGARSTGAGGPSATPTGTSRTTMAGAGSAGSSTASSTPSTGAANAFTLEEDAIRVLALFAVAVGLL